MSQRLIWISVSSQFFTAFFPIALPYYAAGVYLGRLERKRTYFIAAVIAFVLSVGLLFVSIYVPYLRGGELSYKMDSWKSLPAVISSLAAFYAIRYLFENRQFGKITSRTILEISATTFGIYLTHTFLNYRIAGWGFMKTMFSTVPCVATLATELICFVLCGAGIFLLRRIPGFKQIL